MPVISNIIFDLGGVILNLDNKRTEDAFSAMGAGRFREYFRPGFAASVFKEYEVGKINNSQFLQSLRHLLPVDAPEASLIKAWNAMLLDIPPERVSLLEALRRKYRLFLFSNTNALHLDAFREYYRRQYNNRELEDHFEKAYYSHLMGLRKPDTASFQHIIDEQRLEPAATLFVDDTLANVEGANQAGLKGFFLSPGMSIADINWEKPLA